MKNTQLPLSWQLLNTIIVIVIAVGLLIITGVTISVVFPNLIGQVLVGILTIFYSIVAIVFLAKQQVANKISIIIKESISITIRFHISNIFIACVQFFLLGVFISFAILPFISLDGNFALYFLYFLEGTSLFIVILAASIRIDKHITCKQSHNVKSD